MLLKKEIKTVAHLLGSTNRGGAESLVYDILNHSSADTKYVLIFRKKGNFYNDFHKLNIQKVQLKPKGRFDLLYVFKLHRLLKNLNIEVVHSHQLIDGISSILASCLSKRKTVHTFHGRELKKGCVKIFLRRIVMRLMNKNIFVSYSQLKYFESKDGKIFNSEVVYNGVNFSKIKLVKSLRRELNINNQLLLLGSVGNFTSGRNPLFICHFLLKLKNSNIAFNYLFIGGQATTEPEIYNECISYCNKNNLNDLVYFLGVRNDVPLILPQLDSFVYATKTDTFGIGVIEAIASEIPVFVNDTDVMLEITDNGNNAHIYASDDIEDLYENFSIFLTNKNMYREKAFLSSKIIRNKYSIEEYTKNMFNIYVSL